MDVKLSANGRDGALIAQSNGSRDHQGNNAAQLQRYDPKRLSQLNGSPGANARPSLAGEQGGHLKVQLEESPRLRGGIRAIVLPTRSSHALPQFIDVPAGRDLLLTAIGGNGENGLTGEDGGNGLDGESGMNASEVSDATDGSDGGDGGNAGCGGSGENGGNGGSIEIIAHENYMHLFMAVKSDVAGGKGGHRGAHGRPGQGGKGGKGGNGREWREQVGYVYNCTERCVGGDTSSNNSVSVYRAKTFADRRRNLLLAKIGSEIVAGDNMAMMIASAATRFNALRNPQVNTDSCKCHGGQDNCPGCDREPMMRTFRRNDGERGADGRPGAPATGILRKGSGGVPGKVTMTVQRSDGSSETYNSIYSLKLVDFDVEDENGDGIFEPGEHLFVRRFIVENSGEMPSPILPIQLSMIESEWFKLVEGDSGWTTLPSVDKGSPRTIDHPIQVQIREQEEYEPIQTGELFAHRDTIRLRATMPWIEREIPKFGFTKNIEIRYPCELRNFRNAATVALGSLNKLYFEVYNPANLPISPSGASPRVYEIHMEVDPDIGEFETKDGEWKSKVIIRPPSDIPKRAGLELRKKLQIHSDVPSNHHVTVQFKLFLGKPTPLDLSAPEGLNLVYKKVIRLQVSDRYRHNPSASFLLVTNSETGKDRAQSIRRFVNNSLDKEIDTWNVSLEGGLYHRASGNDLDAITNVLSMYHGKTVIFWGNHFDFCGQGTKSVFDLCDPEILSTAAENDTGLLFLDTPDFKPHAKLVNEIVFGPQESVADTKAVIPGSYRSATVSDCISAITQKKQYSPNSYDRYAIAVPSKWYHSGGFKPESLAKTVAKQFQQKLPAGRFLVTFCGPASSRLSWLGSQDSNTSSPEVLIAVRPPYYNSIVALEARSASKRIVGTSACDGISEAEAYMIVQAIPPQERIKRLHETEAAAEITDDNEPRRDFFKKAITYSIVQATHREVELLLDKPQWPDKLLPSNPMKHSVEELEFLFAIHLPVLHSILFCEKAMVPDKDVNENVRLVLSYALATARPQSRRQSVTKALSRTHHRRQRTHDLLKAGITIFLKKKRFKKGQITEFFSSTAKLCKSSISPKRNAGAAVSRLVAELTKQHDNAVRRGKQDVSDLVRGVQYISPQDWDRRVEAVRERSRQVVEERDKAWASLDRMRTFTDNLDSGLHGRHRSELPVL